MTGRGEPTRREARGQHSACQEPGRDNSSAIALIMTLRWASSLRAVAGCGAATARQWHSSRTCPQIGQLPAPHIAQSSIQIYPQALGGEGRPRFDGCRDQMPPRQTPGRTWGQRLASPGEWRPGQLPTQASDAERARRGQPPPYLAWPVTMSAATVRHPRSYHASWPLCGVSKPRTLNRTCPCLACERNREGCE